MSFLDEFNDNMVIVEAISIIQNVQILVRTTRGVAKM